MPYKCQVQGCKRSFVNSTECTRHQKTHSKQVNKLKYQQHIRQSSNDLFFKVWLLFSRENHTLALFLDVIRAILIQYH